VGPAGANGSRLVSMGQVAVESSRAMSTRARNAGCRAARVAASMGAQRRYWGPFFDQRLTVVPAARLAEDRGQPRKSSTSG